MRKICYAIANHLDKFRAVHNIIMIYSYDSETETDLGDLDNEQLEFLADHGLINIMPHIYRMAARWPLSEFKVMAPSIHLEYSAQIAEKLQIEKDSIGHKAFTRSHQA